MFASMVVLILLFRPAGLVPRPMRRLPGTTAMRRADPRLPRLKQEIRRRAWLWTGWTLEVQPGSVLGLIGPNGSGKTTFFNVLTGLFPADAGESRFAGEPITRLRAAGRLPRRHRAHLPALAALPAALHLRESHGGKPPAAWSTGSGSISPGARPGPPDRGQLRGRARPPCASSTRRSPTGCRSRQGRIPMIDRRRVEVCRALISRPRLLLLDEPLRGNDARRDGAPDGRHPSGPAGAGGLDHRPDRARECR